MLNLILCLKMMVFSSSFAGTPPIQGVSLPDLIEKVDTGVVNIQAVTLVRQRMGADPFFEDFFFRFYGVPRESIRKQPSLGSGFVIDNNGYILTNNHVVERASDVEIFFNDQKKTKLNAKVIGLDQKLDVALLKVEPGLYLKPLELGNSDQTRVGETVVAIGNPFGLSHTVTAGIISAKNRVIGQGPLDDFIQTDASINPGNSGGPLFNLSGKVIGINTAINAAGQGLGFAIPINKVTNILTELKKFGRVQRGWMGAFVVTTYHGLFIDALVIKSGADRAGLQSGDQITSADGEKIEEREDLERIVSNKKPGDKIKLKIIRRDQRKEKTLTIDLQLGSEPKNTDIPQGLI
ncbi:MAG: trypsin-like peptidase domain-containing protein [Oligoflexia bacterium]|nr:trypsin-like peptidase domain-containing protein [Oligoflexia bacterium]